VSFCFAAQRENQIPRAIFHGSLHSGCVMQGNLNFFGVAFACFRGLIHGEALSTFMSDQFVDINISDVNVSSFINGGAFS